ncbi:tyrosine-type recombinase/integrase [Pectobacterium aroidearum]|uniref:tyrosine-type recombinase/integrase n=1 Tax=Pectobacterium aroidearum TaxID=1201031 RepID=UPI0031587B5B
MGETLRNTGNFSVLEVKDSAYSFFIEDELWVLSKDVKLNFIRFNKWIKPDLLLYIKKTLAYVAITLSSAYTKKFFYALNKLIVFNSHRLDGFELSLLNRFYNSFVKVNYTHVESLKYFLMKFHELHPELIDKDNYNKIVNWKIKKPNKFSSKSELNISERPLSESELTKVITGATELYNENKIRINDYVLTLILIFTGKRPTQIAMLKNEDLFTRNNECYIKIPRVKQSRPFRTEFTEVKISTTLSEKIYELKKITIFFIEKELNKKLSIKEISNLPLFLDSSFFSKDYDHRNISINNFNCLHMTAKRVTARLQYVCKKLMCYDINSRRLRASLATRVALRGYNMQVIASVLDHTGLGSVQSYAKNNEEYAKRICEAINSKIRPYASLFYNRENKNNYSLINELNTIHDLLKEIKLQFAPINSSLLYGYVSILEIHLLRILDKITKGEK